MTTQTPPFTLQIEPAEGCTLACSFCALQTIRNNGADSNAGVHGKASAPFRFMTLDTARRIASEVKRLGWNPRIEFAMHGEPTAHRDLDLIIDAFRYQLPKVSLMVTSNGSGLLTAGHVGRLFDVGLNTLAFDNYKHAAWSERTLNALRSYSDLFKVPVLHYPENPDASPHGRFFKKRIVVIADITENTSGTHLLTNQGGNVFTSTPNALHARCAKPFRELSIRWDGNVAICCDDWEGSYKIGNINSMDLNVLWDHPRFYAARQALYAGERVLLQPCNKCNVTTYRNGLLPDKFGKETLPLPNVDTIGTIVHANQGKPFSEKL